MLPLEHEKHTYEEFLEITKDIERAEFIDGDIIYMTAPSPEHQRILNRINRKMSDYFDGKECEVYIAPLDVVLQNENIKHTKNVQPDIMVICDKSKFTKISYSGVPTLIVEIISPSNASLDTVRKLNLYEKFEVSEYWIASPKNKTILIYNYDKELKAFAEPTIYSKDDNVKSDIFKDFSIELKSIFE